MGALPETSLDGYNVLRDRVTSALNLLQEARSVDFKEAAMWDEVKKGIPKDILALSNLRDGGIIIIGVAERDNKWLCIGITDEQLKTYDPDNILDWVNRYASPPISLDVVKHTDDQKLSFVVIQAHEFEESPIVCKRDYPTELRRGAFYVRPQGKAESREVQNEEEMRDLLELAADKSGRKFLQRCKRLGLLARVPAEEFALEKLDSQKFDEELEDL